jgi:hypothetical protein
MSEVSFSSSYRARDEDHDNRINYGYDRMNQDFHIGSSFSNQGYRGQRHYRRGIYFELLMKLTAYKLNYF